MFNLIWKKETLAALYGNCLDASVFFLLPKYRIDHPEINDFHHLENIFLDQSIEEMFKLILKTVALVAL